MEVRPLLAQELVSPAEILLRRSALTGALASNRKQRRYPAPIAPAYRSPQAGTNKRHADRRQSAASCGRDGFASTAMPCVSSGASERLLLPDLVNTPRPIRSARWLRPL